MSEALKKALSLVDEARAAILSEIRKESPKPELRNHEYETFQVQDTFVTDNEKNQIRVSHAPDEPIPPGESRTVFFGAEYVFDKGIEGLPETVVRGFGIDRTFLLEHFIIDDACADKITITGMFNGARMFFDPNCRVPGHRFAASTATPVNFKKIIHYGIKFSVYVENTSQVSCVFKARLVGKVPANADEEEKVKKLFTDALSSSPTLHDVLQAVSP